MNLTDQEMLLLENVKTEAEWNAACDQIKGARKGQYPADWWPRVKLSGLMDRVAARFGGDTAIHFEVF